MKDNQIVDGISINKIKKSKISSIDFDNLVFGHIFSDHMFVADYYNNIWNDMTIIPYNTINIYPSLNALHYGQIIFEGLKAYKHKNGKIVLFRPNDNFIRFNLSANRMCMPGIDKETFMNAIINLLKIDRNWIYNKRGYSLYIRPFMFATDTYLGIKPSKKYKFIIFSTPSNLYYKNPLKIKIENYYTRSVKGGTGYIKSGCNYGIALYPTQLAINEGFDQVLWTDYKTHEYIEELSTANIFFVIDNTLWTPNTKDTILNGITRDSIIKIAKNIINIKVYETNIKVDFLINAIKNKNLQEAFAVGTAATITKVSKIGYKNNIYNLPFNKFSISDKILLYLKNIFYGESTDYFKWLVYLD
ncbi:MAG: branched-chain amino acid aminotransferase [Bacteroides sp.]|nr:MAG: branched-chain amino acid aminotransferase [Bacteroides sp.]